MDAVPSGGVGIVFPAPGGGATGTTRRGSEAGRGAVQHDGRRRWAVREGRGGPRAAPIGSARLL